MKANVGKADKFIRIFLGLLIMAVGYVYESWFGLIGIVPVLTAYMSFCPLYAVFGINTCPLKTTKI